MLSIISQDDRLLNSLKNYYKENPDSLNIVIPIVTQKTALSLRLLDWLVTNYSKSNYITYKVNGANFNIYSSYKRELSSYSKKKFDPFCRRKRIFYDHINKAFHKIDSEDELRQYNKNPNGFVTTVGQLNFFRWAVENGIIKYALENIKDLEKNMINTTKNKDKVSKRKELSQNLSKGMTCCKTTIVVKFN